MHTSAGCVLLAGHSASCQRANAPTQSPQILREEDLEALVSDLRVDACLLSYSDLSHAAVMALASRVLAAGADFSLAAPQRTMLRSSKPVVAVCAVRTGCGKSQVSRYVISHLEKAHGKKCVLVRHPVSSPVFVPR